MAALLRMIILALMFVSSGFAKDFGVVGHTFPIIEEDLLAYLKEKMFNMNEDEIQKLTQAVKNHYVEMVRHPNSVKLEEASEYRVYTYDPSITLSKDLYDHEGNLVVAGGSKVNPLQFVSLGADLLIFDGTNKRHLEWVRRQPENGRWILTKGSPIELEEQEGRAIYFDQYGVITKKLGIEKIPARVSQEETETQLKIEEIPL